jgi:hypothetical protein
MNESEEIAAAHAETLKRLREMSLRLAEQACFRASGALGADDADAAARWMETFERLSRGVRLCIALEARVARERDRRARGLPDAPAVAAGPSRWRAPAEPIERDPTERDHEADDDGLPADATLDERIQRIRDIIEEAADEVAPRVRFLPVRPAPSWADVPRSLLELADPEPPDDESG